MALVPVSWVKHCAKQFIRIISFGHLNDYALGIVIGPILWMVTLKHEDIVEEHTE